jgi:SAM-dependent methyltransferase
MLERETPSHAAIWALQEIKRYGTPLRTALDVGCGRGRNSPYLAEQNLQVTATDFKSNAVEQVATYAKAHGLENKIRAIVFDVTDPWPVVHESMDLVIDAFCFTNITTRDARQAYKEQLLQSLRAHGHYMISFGRVGDSYYGQYTLEKSDEDGEKIVVDSVTGVTSVLYSKDHVLQFFGPELILYRELHNPEPSVTHEEYAEHGTYSLLFHRNPHRI